MGNNTRWTAEQYKQYVSPQRRIAKSVDTERLGAARRLGGAYIKVEGKTRLNVAPLSVNRAWKGVRYKTDAYKAFEIAVLSLLPVLIIPNKPYEVYYKFGFSSKRSDIDNPTKMVTDIICKKYGIDDRYISRMILEKEFVEKGKEFFEFEIKTYSL